MVKDELFDRKSAAINQLYRSAPELARQGEQVVSNDGLTGVQAKERKFADKPTAPGLDRRIE